MNVQTPTTPLLEQLAPYTRRLVLSVVLPLPPLGKERATPLGRGKALKGKRTAKWEMDAGWCLRAKWRGASTAKAVAVEVASVIERPSRRPSWVSVEAWSSGRRVPCPVKPDWDNVAKIVCDAMNRIVLKDDAQVVDGHTATFYAAPDEDPCVDVWVYEVAL